MLIHPHPPFPPQPILPHTLNLTSLKRYHLPPAIHIIPNNIIPFTTQTHQSPSTKYPSHFPNGYQIPIL
ncbi:thiamine pyrophosphate-dependent enzyme, partial [Bacillus velezensis]|uniref:thiamine pyrophosphate-dependent enzyme n=1 Tax=Bacillus velezensis TaxID=492670 RepID=UPI0037BFBAFD